MKIPNFMALAAGFLYEKVFRVSSPSWVVQDVDSAKGLSLYWYYDSSKAVRELSFPQTPIEKSLEKTFNWFKENGYI